MSRANPSFHSGQREFEQPRAALAAILRQRRSEIEQATLARVYAVSDPGDVGDSEYVVGLRDAVASGVSYGLAAIEAGRARDPVPVQLLSQARSAARSRVPLDTVLRRYVAGYALFGDFIVHAAAEGVAPLSDLQHVLRGEAALFDRLVASIAEEYRQEAESCSRTAEERRTTQVRMLLRGELVDVAELAYELDAWHIGVIADGPGTEVAIRDLAIALDRSLLSVRVGGARAWAWFGGRCRTLVLHGIFHIGICAR